MVLPYASAQASTGSNSGRGGPQLRSMSPGRESNCTGGSTSSSIGNDGLQYRPASALLGLDLFRRRTGASWKDVSPSLPCAQKQGACMNKRLTAAAVLGLSLGLALTASPASATAVQSSV